MSRYSSDANSSSAFIRQQWDIADANNDGEIQFGEFVTLLRRLRCNSDVGYAMRLYNSGKVEGGRQFRTGLSFDEFKMVVHRLMTHVDVLAYFERYLTDEGDRVMSLDTYVQFLRDIQHADDKEIDQALNVARNLHPPFLSEDGKLTDMGFNALITVTSNSIFNPEKSIQYQDMDRPLTDYYIASSHNTYLTSDQVVGKSAVGQYIEVLLAGCRCVELDCWDGPDGEPIIFHGYTLTSKIPFQAVIKACRDYGFKQNPYPIILSLEMHCSQKQMARIGQILKEELGDALFLPATDSPLEAPSPQALMRRFLVKGKGVDAAGAEEEQGNEDDVQEDELAMREQLLDEFPTEYCVDTYDSQQASIMMRRNAAVPQSEETVELYYSSICLPGRKLSSYLDETRHAMHVCTFNERKLLKLLRNESSQLVAFHRKYLSRIYPAGSRLMSSNYNPTPCWCVGSQMVALNYQAVGMSLLLNLGKFRENGNIGYVLKPGILKYPRFNPNVIDDELLQAVGEPRVHLRVQVLAAQQIPRLRVRDENGHKRDGANPYVTISIQGVPLDTATKKTSQVSNNGLNPRWSNQILDFVIRVPSLALAVIEVRHSDSVRSEYLAGNAIPVNCLRPGLRWVPLYDVTARLVGWSGLIVFVELTKTWPGRDCEARTSCI